MPTRQKEVPKATVKTNQRPPKGYVKDWGLTRRELAHQLGISLRTVDHWVVAKKIPVFKPSRRTVRFDLDDVLQALKHFVIQAEEEP